MYKRTIIDGIEYKLVPVKRSGRPKKLDTNNKALLETLLLQKTYMTQRELAEYYDVSMATMARAMKKAKEYAKTAE